jgi:SAM-dependent methyltransferase
MDWDERYASVEFAYGTRENDFLREQVEAGDWRPGRALCLAEGEGRNGLYLAKRGWSVTGVDQSRVGLEKFERMAAEARVEVTTVTANLADFELGNARWELIVSIWCHVPSTLRRTLHASLVRALTPGGHLVLEAYHPRQLDLKTGGPPTADPMMTVEGLRQELVGLRFLVAEELEREIHEGPFHNGPSAVTRVVAERPR